MVEKEFGAQVKSDYTNMENEERSFVMDDDVLIEILLLLPAKMLGQFKSVCKNWYNLIQNPKFITNHYNRQNSHNHNNHLLVVHSMCRKGKNEISFTLFLHESLLVRKNIDFSLISKNRHCVNILEVLGPVNGLCLIHYDYNEADNEEFLCLWNPTTSEFRKLKFPTKVVLSSLGTHYGFGCTDGDIKVVCVTPFKGFDTDIDTENDGYRFVASLYSLAHDCWKTIEINTNLVYKSIYNMTDSAYLNGATYWLVRNTRYNVIVFDMKTEMLREVPLPAENLLYNEKNDRKYSYYDRLLVRNSFVVLFVTKLSSYEDYYSEVVDCVDVWEMKEEGCWNKIFSFVPSFYYTAPLGFWKDDEIIFRSEDGTLFLYNIFFKERRNLGIDADISVMVYKESLTSVEGGRSTDLTHLE